MKITKQTLKQIIKEEITKFLYEDEYALDTKLVSNAQVDGASDALDGGNRGERWKLEYGGKYLKTYLDEYEERQSAALEYGGRYARLSDEDDQTR